MPINEKETERTICEMVCVREYCEGMPVELGRSESGRLVIRALNEDGYNSTEVDLWDLIEWLKNGPKSTETRALLATGTPGFGT